MTVDISGNIWRRTVTAAALKFHVPHRARWYPPGKEVNVI
jgi:hypothetical protein